MEREERMVVKVTRTETQRLEEWRLKWTEMCCMCVCVCAHKMQESDEILEINGRSTDCMLHSVAICIIKHGDDSLKLVVRRAVKDGYEGRYVCAYAVHVCVCVC